MLYQIKYPGWYWFGALLECKGTDGWIKCRLAFYTNLPPCLYSFIYLTHPVIIFFLIIHANCMIQSSRSLYYCKDKGKWLLLFNINPLSLIWHVCVVVRYCVPDWSIFCAWIFTSNRNVILGLVLNCKWFL